MTKRERWIAVGLVALWALLFLPNLRTNPNWYGDEGEWMEKCWTFIHGTPRVGPVTNDFIYPYPYPPLYMLVNGVLLSVFGNDLVVGRALGALTALAAAGILFWIGCLLRGRAFGFLCAAAFLVYPETVMNFRWVRSHPMAGTLALASCGFLIRYLQQKRLRDVVWAGIFCALGTAANYYIAPLIVALIVTVACVNWRHSFVAAITAGSFGVVFVLWYASSKGAPHLMEQVHRLGGMTGEAKPAWHWFANLFRFCFKTPIVSATGTQFIDLWPALAAVGVALFPEKRFRKWIALWTLVLMSVVFKKQDNVPIFFYPATLFLPLMALGVAGLLERTGKLKPVAMAVVLGAFGLTSAYGSLTHFRTKVDFFTQQAASVDAAEKVMAYVNDHTAAEDFVLVPKQLYWKVKRAKKSMLSHCVTITGGTNDAWPVPIPPEVFWFDCRWQDAKFAVIASGILGGRQPIGIDMIYTRGLAGVPEAVDGMIREQWPIVAVAGEKAAVVNIGSNRWPVVVNGEYLVLANPRLVK